MMNSVNTASAPKTNNAMARLVLDNDLEELTTLSEWVSDVTTDLDVSGRTAFAIDLALTEAVTNVLSYAFPDDEPHHLEITLIPTESALTVKISDDGKPFDPLNRAAANLPASLDEADIGGLGIHLIRNYASDCRYRREDGHNILTLIFDRTEPSP